jgi:phenylpropionate dioxygenase-like ring-hydroxylating dioxygenase large terminal subunit
LLDADSRAVPAAFRDHSYVDQGIAEVSKARYTSRDFAELEGDYVWRRTWQMACREEDIPHPGDHVVYEVADESLLVTRTNAGHIRAFHNSCLHRGTKLRLEDGRVGSFRCPFHGWRWDLEGTLVEMTCDWDFPLLRADPVATSLPEARTATWAGFVFVNLDPVCEPFEHYAAKLIEHFRELPFARCYKAFHAVKEVPANWKVCMEAFSEAYHVLATHPQLAPFSGDANSEYSIWPDAPYVTRFVNAFGVQSPHLGLDAPEQRVVDAFLAFSARGGGESLRIASGETAREALAALFRRRMMAAFRTDLSTASDAEILDAILYHLFPAFAPWAGVGQPLVYRWRPGPTPDTCFMDIMRLQPWPDGPRPSPAPVIHLTLDQAWADAPGMGTLGAVLAQDMANLPRVQAGLKSTGKRTVTFGNYQEGRLRMLHRTIDRFILDGLARDGRPRSVVEPFLVPAG